MELDRVGDRQTPCPQAITFVVNRFMDARQRQDWSAMQEVLSVRALQNLNQAFLFQEAAFNRFDVISCQAGAAGGYSVVLRLYPATPGKPPTAYWPESVRMVPVDNQFKVDDVKRGPLVIGS